MHYPARTISYRSPQELCSSSGKKLDMGIRRGAGVEIRSRLTEEISNYERIALHLLVHCDIQKAEVNTQAMNGNA
jgi:hypothetical protein